MNKTSLSLAVAGLLVSAGAVSAATVTDTFQVTAEVTAACVIDTTGALAFGAYNSVSGAAIDGSTTVGVRCTNGHPYDIGLNLGANADVSARRMVHSTEAAAFLGYQLYSEATRATVWGDAVGTTTVAETGNGAEQTKTIYGRIAADQFVATKGTYADTITITVTY